MRKKSSLARKLTRKEKRDLDIEIVFLEGVVERDHSYIDALQILGDDYTRRGRYPDGLKITPAKIKPATIETYDDHRMAMSFAVTGLKAKGIVISNPECTAKTYPRFFEDMAALVGH